MEILTLLNLTNDQLVVEVNTTYSARKFVVNCELFRIKTIDGIESLKKLIKKFKKFDKMSISKQMALILTTN
jgi:hypothetical protein